MVSLMTNRRELLLIQTGWAVRVSTALGVPHRLKVPPLQYAFATELT